MLFTIGTPIPKIPDTSLSASSTFAHCASADGRCVLSMVWPDCVEVRVIARLNAANLAFASSTADADVYAFGAAAAGAAACAAAAATTAEISGLAGDAGGAATC